MANAQIEVSGRRIWTDRFHWVSGEQRGEFEGRVYRSGKTH